MEKGPKSSNESSTDSCLSDHGKDDVASADLAKIKNTWDLKHRKKSVLKQSVELPRDKVEATPSPKREIMNFTPQ